MKRKSPLSERKTIRALRAGAQWGVLPAAFLATLLGVPVNAAVLIPGDPLASGVRVAPNILFILDDSGSMAWENINNGDISAITGSGGFSDGPDSNGVTTGNTGDYTDATGNGKMYDQNYSSNTLYYNPSVDYEPWYNATGYRLTGGTAYDSAFSNTNFVNYTGVESNTSSSTVDLSGNTRTFYAPESESSDLTKIADYYRFQILAGGTRIMRGNYGQVAITAGSPSISPSSGSATGTAATSNTGVVTAGRSVEFTINNTSSTSGTTTRSLVYSVVTPSGSTACSATLTRGTSATCLVYPAEAGVQIPFPGPRPAPG